MDQVGQEKVRAPKNRPRKGIDESVDVSEHEMARRTPEVFDLLLRDQTTGRYILWATDSYLGYRDEKYRYAFSISREDIEQHFGPNNEIYPADVTPSFSGDLFVEKSLTRVVCPRCCKAREEQQQRVKDKAEVFTPSWICNKQNNLIDEQWFGRSNVFNTEETNPLTNLPWVTMPSPIVFDSQQPGKSWQHYVRDKRLEMCCGEAPYLTSRYDTVTGVAIPVAERIGILDRKLRVISENVRRKNKEAQAGLWRKWALVALSATYGVEYQGDNLLLARETLLYSILDAYMAEFGRRPSRAFLLKAAEIISWNIWQMDVLTDCIPGTEICAKIRQWRIYAGHDGPHDPEGGAPFTFRSLHDDRYVQSNLFAESIS